jgi:hypothetical protein
MRALIGERSKGGTGWVEGPARGDRTTRSATQGEHRLSRVGNRRRARGCDRLKETDNTTRRCCVKRFTRRTLVSTGEGTLANFELEKSRFPRCYMLRQDRDLEKSKATGCHLRRTPQPPR